MVRRAGKREGKQDKHANRGSWRRTNNRGGCQLCRQRSAREFGDLGGARLRHADDRWVSKSFSNFQETSSLAHTQHTKQQTKKQQIHDKTRRKSVFSSPQSIAREKRTSSPHIPIPGKPARPFFARPSPQQHPAKSNTPQLTVFQTLLYCFFVVIRNRLFFLPSKSLLSPQHLSSWYNQFACSLPGGLSACT